MCSCIFVDLKLFRVPNIFKFFERKLNVHMFNNKVLEADLIYKLVVDNFLILSFVESQIYLKSNM